LWADLKIGNPLEIIYINPIYIKHNMKTANKSDEN
jgi:hypothetical protein